VSIAAGVGLVVAPIVLSATPAAASGPAATVTGVSPVSGVSAGGNTVTIKGTNLGSTLTTTVDFGATPATSVVVNANGTSLTATAPSNPNTPAATTVGSTFDVLVNNGAGSGASAANKGDQYTYEFNNDTCGASPFNSSCAATLTAQETLPVVGTAVTGTAGGADNVQVPVNATVTLTANDAGTVATALFSLSIVDVSTSPPTIEINAHAATTVSTTVPENIAYEGRFVAEADHCPTQPTFPSPPTGTCGLTPIGGNSDPVVVQWAAPTVTAVSPSIGPLTGGTSVTVTGTNLTGATAVNFGPDPATTFAVNNATSITATSPAEAAGTVDVTVVTPAGTSATGAPDLFTYGPTVSAVSPTRGPIAGGTPVTVTGSGFTGATVVDFGATAGTSLSVTNDTTLTIVSPAHVAGLVDVTVTAPGGISAISSADQFTYFAVPTVTAVSPLVGPASGGTSVTVTGTNLTGESAVDFGPSAGTTVVVNGGGTSLTVTSPAGTGVVDVTVTTPGGTSAVSSADQFTFQGYWMVGNDGGIFSFGGAPFEGSLPGLGIHVTNVVGMVPTADGKGYWMIGTDGGVFAFGDAGFVGSIPGLGIHINNIVGAVPTADGKGYWMVGSDGGVFAFGDAGFVGSIPGLGIHVNNIVAVVPTSTGKGYWMIGSDGGVFAFGDAGFVGSLPGINVHVSNVVGAVPTSTGKGYWMVGKDGGVFAFGDAGFVGSLPGINVHVSNIVGVVATSTGKGYWMVGSDGGVFAFGDAGFVGSIPGLGIHITNIVAFARQ
jgi:hypothetical protein